MHVTRRKYVLVTAMSVTLAIALVALVTVRALLSTWLPGDDLGFAAKRGDRELVESLIARGAPINAKCRTSKDPTLWSTPLHRAATGGDPQIVKMLLAAGADTNGRDFEGSTPLWMPMGTVYDGKKRLACIKALLDGGADVNAQNDRGLTALHWAVLHGQPDTVKLLCERQANVNLRDDNGKTPLHWAPTAREGKAIAQILLANGADVSIQDARGESAFDAARELIEGTIDINRD